MSEILIDLQLEKANEAQNLFGPNDSHLKIMEQKLGVSIVTRGEKILVAGEDAKISIVNDVIDALITLIRKGTHISERDIIYAVQLAEKGMLEELLELYQEKIAVNVKGKPILVKTLGQRHYITALRKRDIVFGIGPAGTGKTYLAVVMAVTALKDGFVKRIVLTRPAVEAGESLGFLPGDLKEKVDPYLRPLYDALHDVLGVEQTARLMERGTIEIAPLAYMRGRTLDDSFVILDEAQNTTSEQIKMFLTRLGFGSKMVITGDLTQIDLPKGKKSGLKTALEVLNDVQGIDFIHLQATDVVRHTLVQKVINAYEKSDKE
ncbi:phosphate starvation-inducible protein PhoH [Anaerobacillus alkalidiazotrophicus]|uniref:PhoH-like protein n=1 Tax=Anaerobacillus alkalidiazotrophicus TaxID=472963 RepID=A0A1S2MBJ1_9BACI|nr:PhoH family protein [Anaerobacillus alkalidiazotrophicus]OIJ22132.1 phosphate starvation-inducible protein PhoH [Anaerobacillus alkalidiazotrophicus]